MYSFIFNNYFIIVNNKITIFIIQKKYDFYNIIPGNPALLILYFK